MVSRSGTRNECSEELKYDRRRASGHEAWPFCISRNSGFWVTSTFGELTGALGEIPSMRALRGLMKSGVASVLSEGYSVGTLSLARRCRCAVSMSCGENFPFARFKIGLGFRLLVDVVCTGCGLNLRGVGCWPHSSANLCRLGLGELFTGVPPGSEGEGWFVVWVVSMGSTANLRLLRCVVSTGSGANLRFVFTLVSTGSGANLRLLFVVVSTGSGANLRTGFVSALSASMFLSLEDDTDVSIGSTLKRLGGAFEAMIYMLICLTDSVVLCPFNLIEAVYPIGYANYKLCVRSRGVTSATPTVRCRSWKHMRTRGRRREISEACICAKLACVACQMADKWLEHCRGATCTG